jgi:hypothetical protein
MDEKTIVYFRKPGKQNTRRLIRIVRERISTTNISHVVVASTSGETAVTLAAEMKDSDCPVICVAEHAGFAGGDTQLLTRANRDRLAEMKVPVVVGSHVLSGVERGLSGKFGGVNPVEIMAFTLRLLGCEGIKVAVEIAVMAADAGLIPTDREILTITGSGKGADTAVILKAAHMNNIGELEIREILAKPRQRHGDSPNP